MQKTTAEKIAAKREQIALCENQIKQLEKKQKKEVRDARTKRLIERGAILEKFIEDAAGYTNDEIMMFLKQTITTDFAKKVLEKIKAMRIPTVKDESVPDLPNTPANSADTANEQISLSNSREPVYENDDEEDTEGFADYYDNDEEDE